jgi:hypothetical protein
VAAALRMAALSLRHSQTALGAYYRKLAQRLGGDIAVFATARKLATLIYRLLRWGQPRDGVAYLLAKYARLAAHTTPALTKRRLTPHVMRHYLPFLTMSCKSAEGPIFRASTSGCIDIF